MAPYRVWSPASLPRGEPRNNRKANCLVVYCGQHQCFFLFLFWKTVPGLSKGHRDDPNEWGCGTSWCYMCPRMHLKEQLKPETEKLWPNLQRAESLPVTSTWSPNSSESPLMSDGFWLIFWKRGPHFISLLFWKWKENIFQVMWSCVIFG